MKMPTLTADAENKADYKCAEHAAMIEDLTLVRDVERGTRQVRSKKEKYLHKWPGEKPKQYEARLKQAYFFNTFRKIRNGLVGMIKDPVLESDVDAEIKAHMENVDLAGSHLDVFTKEVERKVLEGHVFIFVDMEKPLPAGSTVYQATAKNRRPFWVIYAKDAACNWQDDRINGEQVLTQITFEECATVKAGRYGRKQVYQYRSMWLPVTAQDEQGNPTEYGPMEWELLRKAEDSNAPMIRIDGGTTKLPRIPVVTIYSIRRAFMESDPLLLDLAHLNVAHYQQWSNLTTLQRSLVPILVVKRVDAKPAGAVPPMPADTNNEAQPEELHIGPNVTVDLYGENDQLEYVSADPQAVEAARQNVVDLESRMSAIGLSLIGPKDEVEVTATDKIIDQKERVSELGDVTRAVKDGIEAALQLHAEYMGKKDGGSVILELDTADASSLKPEPAPMPMPGQGGKDTPAPAPAPTGAQ